MLAMTVDDRKARLDYDYLQFLAEIINIGEAPLDDNYWRLITYLHQIPYEFIIAKDENRMDDGEKLRDLYFDSEGIYPILPYRCSMFEFLVGVSRRMEDILEDPYVGDQTGHRFYELIDNIGLSFCMDDNYCGREIIRRQVDIVIDRTYDRTGRGGLFPLKYGRKDQRMVEVWYQMNAYLLENYYIDDD